MNTEVNREERQVAKGGILVMRIVAPKGPSTNLKKNKEQKQDFKT